ncbi:hypothetical protein K2173_027682 [Erythroxylum novogranatense]|uniref:Uncharacterized protein n=1 Tax=Erythroxylum novogranatense TaxID=1862640 RepID=A0AAV8U299_9ROSI|nr:hypothetical protein K2173_027682 [Erythroxylum novogranatense]
MEVEVISRECIKPSSPTIHHHLKPHKLSLLDQFAPSYYFPVLLFYSGSQKYSDLLTSGRSLNLKQSLSETLNLFYPFAGKIKDHVSVEFNDNGVYYVVARMNCSLNECLNNPDHRNSLQKFLPSEAAPFSVPIPGSHVFLVQETSFSCGGIAIGVSVWHGFCDGIGLTSFLKAWSAKAIKSSESETIIPDFSASSIFLPNDTNPTEANVVSLRSRFQRIGIVQTRRFVFDARCLTRLKDKATSTEVKNPTRVEAVCALLSKCVMAAVNRNSRTCKPTFISNAINIRRRALPPLPNLSIGNFVWDTTILSTAMEADISRFILEMREAIAEINEDFVRKLQGDGGLAQIYRLIREMSEDFDSVESVEGVEHVSITSWCNFGLYDIDFGFGKPIWLPVLTSNGMKREFFNLIILMDSKEEKGIEAWVTLDEPEMVALEQDSELLAYASIDPPLMLH